jgi:hypothetical protein
MASLLTSDHQKGSSSLSSPGEGSRLDNPKVITLAPMVEGIMNSRQIRESIVRVKHLKREVKSSLSQTSKMEVGRTEKTPSLANDLLALSLPTIV